MDNPTKPCNNLKRKRQKARTRDIIAHVSKENESQGVDTQERDALVITANKRDYWFNVAKPYNLSTTPSHGHLSM